MCTILNGCVLRFSVEVRLGDHYGVVMSDDRSQDWSWLPKSLRR
jgi:hypothetical protein